MASGSWRQGQGHGVRVMASGSWRQGHGVGVVGSWRKATKVAGESNAPGLETRLARLLTAPVPRKLERKKVD